MSHQENDRKIDELKIGQHIFKYEPVGFSNVETYEVIRIDEIKTIERTQKLYVAVNTRQKERCIGMIRDGLIALKIDDNGDLDGFFLNTFPVMEQCEDKRGYYFLLDDTIFDNRPEISTKFFFRSEVELNTYLLEKSINTAKEKIGCAEDTIKEKEEELSMLTEKLRNLSQKE